MSARTIVLGFGLLLLGATPLAAQERGTVEFGGFASGNTFDESLGMNNGWGAGGRLGAFLLPRLSMEFEAGGLTAGRTLGLQDVNVGILSARLTAVPLQFGRLSVLVGGGLDHTDTYVVERFGVHAMVGARVALSNVLALRVGGIQSFMVRHEGSNRSLQVGLSAFRSPSN